MEPVNIGAGTWDSETGIAVRVEGTITYLQESWIREGESPGEALLCGPPAPLVAVHCQHTTHSCRVSLSIKVKHKTRVEGHLDTWVMHC